jgi:hypothetical protein
MANNTWSATLSEIIPRGGFCFTCTPFFIVTVKNVFYSGAGHGRDCETAGLVLRQHGCSSGITTNWRATLISPTNENLYVTEEPFMHLTVSWDSLICCVTEGFRPSGGEGRGETGWQITICWPLIFLAPGIIDFLLYTGPEKSVVNR